MEGKLKEVRFDIFCRSCSFYPESSTKEPCTTCLGVPGREESHKPEKYRQTRPEIYYLLPDGKTYTYDLRKAKNWDQLPTDAELRRYFFMGGTGNYYEKGVN